MLLTEKEAAEKWCPHGRFANGTQATNCAVNAAYTNLTDGEVTCIGSRCMQWQWRDLAYEFSTQTGGPPPHGDGWDDGHQNGPCITYRRPLGERRRGYCGLAGKPEFE